MKFIDEAKIEVHAGNGGDGAPPSGARSSCRAAGRTAATAAAAAASGRVADRNINTLIDYRFARIHRAENGEQRHGRGLQYGRGGERHRAARAGRHRDHATQRAATCSPTSRRTAQRALLARGGEGGLGNLHFKSSINRAPRQFTRGEPGEVAQARARAARARRRRPARPAERRQVDLHPRGLERAAQGGRLSVHHARSLARAWCASGDERASSSPTFRGSSKAPPKAPASATSSCATSRAPGCCCTWSTLRRRGRDPAQDARAIAAELKKYDEALYTQAALAGVQQGRRRRRRRRAHRQDPAADCAGSGPGSRSRAISGEGCRAAHRKAVARELRVAQHAA